MSFTANNGGGVTMSLWTGYAIIKVLIIIHFISHCNVKIFSHCGVRYNEVYTEIMRHRSILFLSVFSISLLFISGEVYAGHRTPQPFCGDGVFEITEKEDESSTCPWDSPKRLFCKDWRDNQYPLGQPCYASLPNQEPHGICGWPRKCRPDLLGISPLATTISLNPNKANVGERVTVTVFDPKREGTAITSTAFLKRIESNGSKEYLVNFCGGMCIGGIAKDQYWDQLNWGQLTNRVAGPLRQTASKDTFEGSLTIQEPGTYIVEVITAFGRRLESAPLVIGALAQSTVEKKKPETDACENIVVKRVKGDVEIQRNTGELESKQRAFLEAWSNLQAAREALIDSVSRAEPGEISYEKEDALRKAEEIYEERARAMMEAHHAMEKWIPVTEGMIVGIFDLVQTGFDSEADICVPKENIITIGPLSQAQIETPLSLTRTTVGLRMGALNLNVRGVAGSTDFRVSSPNVTTGVRGTTFNIVVTNQKRDELLRKGKTSQQENRQVFEDAMLNYKDLTTTVTLQEGKIALQVGEKVIVSLPSTEEKVGKTAVVRISTQGIPILETEETTKRTSVQGTEEITQAPQRNNMFIIILFLVLIAGVGGYFVIRAKKRSF